MLMLQCLPCHYFYRVYNNNQNDEKPMIKFPAGCFLLKGIQLLGLKATNNFYICFNEGVIL